MTFNLPASLLRRTCSQYKKKNLRLERVLERSIYIYIYTSFKNIGHARDVRKFRMSEDQQKTILNTLISINNTKFEGTAV